MLLDTKYLIPVWTSNFSYCLSPAPQTQNYKAKFLFLPRFALSMIFILFLLCNLETLQVPSIFPSTSYLLAMFNLCQFYLKKWYQIVAEKSYFEVIKCLSSHINFHPPQCKQEYSISLRGIIIIINEWENKKIKNYVE